MPCNGDIAAPHHSVRIDREGLPPQTFLQYLHIVQQYGIDPARCPRRPGDAPRHRGDPMAQAAATSLGDIEAPVLDVDPYSDAVLENPHAMYAAVRAAGHVGYLSRYGVHVMGRHASIVPVLKDWETYSSTGGSGLGDIRKPGAWRPASPIVEVDPPEHTRVRTALQRILSPALIRAWREDFEREADRQVAALVEQGTFCGVHDLAEAYVSTTFPDALGLAKSPERRDNLFLLGALNFDGQGPKNARFDATQAKADAIQDWYQAMMRREAMVPGGFGEKIFLAADAGEIEPEVAPLLVRSFLRGGLDFDLQHHLGGALVSGAGPRPVGAAARGSGKARAWRAGGGDAAGDADPERLPPDHARGRDRGHARAL
ncbi:MAG: hypothetical protein QM722_00800 [Piscinibacter sp.]